MILYYKYNFLNGINLFILQLMIIAIVDCHPVSTC